MKIVKFTRGPIKFANQHEAATKYFILFLIALLNVMITICINIVSFAFIFPHIIQENIPYSIGLIVTALVPLMLFFTTLTLFILPIVPPSKANDNDKELFLNRDFIKIINEL